MKDKLYIDLSKSKNKALHQGVIKITPEAAEELLKLQSRCGLPIRQLASALILFASQRVEFIYDDYLD